MAHPLAHIRTTAGVPALVTRRRRGLKCTGFQRVAAARWPSPMSDNRDICFLPASDLVRLYRARKASPLEVMQAVLARIDAVNPVVNAYVTVARESALAAARRATHMLGRKATRLPLLHGVPVSIKDLFATKGIRTTWGSVIYKDHVPDGDDLAVQRLKAAGAIVVGKTNTPEFGAGGNTFN